MNRKEKPERVTLLGFPEHKIGCSLKFRNNPNKEKGFR